MIKEFKGDYRIMRVVMASDNPINTLQKIRTNQYSIITLLDVLEMLDVKDTLEEQSMKEIERNNKKSGGNR